MPKMNNLEKDSKISPQERDPAKAKKSPFQARSKFSPGNILLFLKNIFASTQNIIGLDIGTGYIKIVQLQKTKGGYAVTNFITRAISREVRDNLESKKDLVQKFVKEFIAEARVKTRLARWVISGKGVFIFSLSVPFLSKKDLRGAVSIELKKRLPFQISLDNISFDYFVAGQLKDEKGVNLLQVTCIAVDNLVIAEGLEFLKEMNLRPTVINVVPDALANLIPLCLATKSNQNVAVLDIGVNASLLNFYKGDTLQFFREIPVGGEHISKALTKTIVTSTGTVNLTAEDAEKVKRQCGIPLEDEAETEYLTDFAVLLGRQISTMLRPTLEQLITELSRTFNYYTKIFRLSKIEGLYLTGGSCRLKNIEKFLLANLEGINRLERLDTLKAVKGWADVSIFKQELVMEQAAPHLGAAFGICLGNGGKVNLLPLKERIEQRLNFLMFLVKFSFPIILALGVLFYTSVYIGGLRYKALIKRTAVDISSLEPIVSRIRDYLTLKSRMDERKGLLEKAVGRQPLWGGILKELSIITPGQVILNEVTVTEGEQPLKIHLAGEILAKYTTLELALSQYLLALDESPFFSYVQLLSQEKDMYSVMPRATFEIICQLRY